MLTGDNGILTKASDAKEKTQKAQAEEEVRLAVLASIGTDGKIDPGDLKDNLNKIKGIETITEDIEIDTDGYKVKVNGYEFTIKKDGDVQFAGGSYEEGGSSQTPTEPSKPLTEITIAEADKNVEIVGTESKEITVTKTPVDATEEMTYEIENENVATVEIEGEKVTITGKAGGTTKITLKGTTEGVKVEITVTVTEEGETVSTQNRTLAGATTGFGFKNPVIPQGFYPKDEGSAKWKYKDSGKTEVEGWNEGLVITDAENGGEGGNEFVWVPVDGTTVAYTKNLSYPNNYSATSSNTSNDTSVYLVANENTQIANGGFYVARYESGYASASSNSTSPNNSGTIVPVSKKGTKILNNISYTNAAASAKLMINDTTKYGNNKSGLITGTQWDTIMDWYNESGIGVIGSSTTNTAGNTVPAQNWGTYRNLTYNGTGSYFTRTSTSSSSISAWQSGDFSHTGTTTSVSASSPNHYHASGLNSAGMRV